MTTAYDEIYLNRARMTLGNMLHFAVYDLGRNITAFYDAFISSGLAGRFGKGEPKLTVGLSGIELAYEVLAKTTGEICDTVPVPAFDRSPEYWTGWVLAYYEWYRNVPFERINNVVPISEIVDMYSPMHEADILKFVDVIDKKLAEDIETKRLARLRAYAGLTQKMLAEKTGVSLRMIEQYEQGRKDINHASAETVYKLAKSLGCSMEELIEI